MYKLILGTLLGVAVLIGSGTTSAATLALYDFTGNVLTSSDTDPDSLAGDFGSSGITNTSVADTFDFTDADADTGDYLFFTLTPGTGYTLDLTSLSFTALRSKTQGSVLIEARSSLDSYASLLPFSAPPPVAVSKTLGGNSLTAFTIDLSDAAFDTIDSSGITFQLYFTADSNVSSRVTSIDTVTVDGTSSLTPVGLPPTVWLMGSGLLGLAGISRRALK